MQLATFCAMLYVQREPTATKPSLIAAPHCTGGSCSWVGAGVVGVVAGIVVLGIGVEVGGMVAACVVAGCVVGTTVALVTRIVGAGGVVLESVVALGTAVVVLENGIVVESGVVVSSGVVVASCTVVGSGVVVVVVVGFVAGAAVFGLLVADALTLKIMVLMQTTVGFHKSHETLKS